jgi:hypothetical protein
MIPQVDSGRSGKVPTSSVAQNSDSVNENQDD